MVYTRLMLKGTKRPSDRQWDNTLIPSPDKEELIELYVNKKLSTHALGRHYGVTQTLARSWLARNGIKTRSRKEVPSGRPGKDDKHHSWKGEDVSYSALHTWVRSRKGTPMKCEHCGSVDKKQYHWASVNHSYIRDVDAWIRLCPKCHKAYDREHGTRRDKK